MGLFEQKPVERKKGSYNLTQQSGQDAQIGDLAAQLSALMQSPFVQDTLAQLFPGQHEVTTGQAKGNALAYVPLQSLANPTAGDTIHFTRGSEGKSNYEQELLLGHESTHQAQRFGERLKDPETDRLLQDLEVIFDRVKKGEATVKPEINPAKDINSRDRELRTMANRDEHAAYAVQSALNLLRQKNSNSPTFWNKLKVNAEKEIPGTSRALSFLITRLAESKKKP